MWGALIGIPRVKVLQDPLYSNIASPSFDNLAELWLMSWHEALGQDLSEVLVSRSCGAPGEIHEEVLP